MKKVMVFVISIGIILSTTIAVWGFDSDNPYKPSSIAPTTITVANK